VATTTIVSAFSNTGALLTAVGVVVSFVVVVVAAVVVLVLHPPPQAESASMVTSDSVARFHLCITSLSNAILQKKRKSSFIIWLNKR